MIVQIIHNSAVDTIYNSTVYIISIAYKDMWSCHIIKDIYTYFYFLEGETR